MNESTIESLSGKEKREPKELYKHTSIKDLTDCTKVYALTIARVCNVCIEFDKVSPNVC